MAGKKERSSYGELATYILVLLLAGLPSILVAEEALAEHASDRWGLGQVISEGVTMEGIRVPPGSTLTGESLLETGDRPAVVHLQGGQVLRLASYSSIYFGEEAAGNVRMHVRSGNATMRGREADPQSLAEDMYAVISRDGVSRVGYRTASLTSGPDPNPRQEPETETEAGAPAISGAKKACLPNVPYPLLDAVIQPGADVQVAKVYFRAAQHPDFYAVEMKGTLDDFAGILPAPGPGTDQVVYYVEAVSSSLESSRTEEFTADVIDDAACEDRSGAGLFSGKKPVIAVLPVTPGSPLVPPGFLPLGIAGAAGGGLGAGAIGGIVAGGVLGGVVLIDQLDDDDESPASPVTP